MKIPQGREQIGEYNGLPLVIDWADLLHYKGKQIPRYKAEKALGTMLRLLGILAMGGAVVWTFFVAAWPDLGIIIARTPQELLFWAGVLDFVYGRYLLRDRDRFQFNLEREQFSELLNAIPGGKVKEIEIDDYMTFPILSLIDKSFYEHHDSFVDDMIDYTLTHKKVKPLMHRLGVDPVTFREKALANAKLINTNWDLHYKGLFNAVFNKSLELVFEDINAVSFFFVFADHLWKQQLEEFDVQQDALEALQLWLKTENQRDKYVRIWHQMAYLKPTGTVNRAYTSRYAPTLETYGEDYTRQAAQGAFVTSIGREEEMQQVINILQRPDGMAGLIIGPSGVGKSHFLRHLAVRMVVEDVPIELKDKRLVVFDFTRAYTDSVSLDDFKAILQNLFDEVIKTKDVVLVLDEVEQLINIRKDNQQEVMNILENAIRNTDMQILATTNSANYRRILESNQSMSSLFEIVEMAEPSALVALQVLIDETPKLEAEHGVSVEVNALELIIKLAPQYDHDRVMPIKAIAILEEVMVEARNKGEVYLTEETVSQVVSRKVGVNVGKITKEEADKLLKLEETLHQRVVGQDAAIKAVAAALRRARAGFNKGDRPISTFLFFGPTGVGKTEVAKTLAAQYYGDAKMMVRVDMSEYQEEENLGRLIGELKDGEFSGGFLTEAVRSKPFSLVLLDELEKANPKVLDLFLQILDEGTITDGAGRKVSFANTIIVATSNAGSRQIAELIGQGAKYDEVVKQVTPVLRTVYRVEFLNRFDRVIMFKPLSQIEVQEIARRMLEGLKEQMFDEGVDVEFADAALLQISELGYDPVYGARQLGRVIQEQVQDKIAEAVVKGELISGKKMVFNTIENVVVV